MTYSVNFRMVRLGREFGGLSQTALAARSGLAQARLSRIETGQVEPSAEELAALGDVLGLPATFFTEPGSPVAAPLFRKRAIRSVGRLAAIQARINVAVLVAQRLVDAGVEIDKPQYVPEPGQFPPDEAWHAALALRRAWHLPAGRIDDLTGVIESAAGIVLRVDFGTDDASAAFVPSRDGRLWFLVNTREWAGDRVRLSLAHELGHAVLHRMLPRHDEVEFEHQAFDFAAAFLLPPDHFDRAVPFDSLTLTDARRLKRAFGVSMQAIIRAAYDRRRISRPRYISLLKQLSARQWRTTEPDPISLERPELWEEILRVHRDEHGYTDFELADIGRVGDDVLADLFPESFQRRGALRLVRSNGSFGSTRPPHDHVPDSPHSAIPSQSA